MLGLLQKHKSYYTKIKYTIAAANFLQIMIWNMNQIQYSTLKRKQVKKQVREYFVVMFTFLGRWNFESERFFYKS